VLFTIHYSRLYDRQNRLADDRRRQHGRPSRGIVARRHLHKIQAHDVEQAQPPHESKEILAADALGFRVPCPRRFRRIESVDVNRDVDWPRLEPGPDRARDFESRSAVP